MGGRTVVSRIAVSTTGPAVQGYCLPARATGKRTARLPGSSLPAGRRHAFFATSRFMTKYRFLRGTMVSMVSMAAAGGAFAARPETRNRAEIPAQYRWDFSPIYPSWDAWAEGMKAMEAKMD